MVAFTRNILSTIYFLLFSLFSLTAKTQGTYTPTDSLKIFKVLEYAERLINENGKRELAFQQAEQAYSMSSNLQFKRGEAHALLMLSQVAFKKSAYVQLDEFNSKALLLGTLLRDSNVLAGVYTNLGIQASYQSKQNDAIGLFQKALDTKYEKEQSGKTASVYNHMGNAYMELGELDKQMEWQIKSLRLAEKINDKNIIAQELDNIAGLYLELGKNSEAIAYARNALIIRKEAGNYEGLSLSYNNLSQIFLFSDSLQQAIVNGELGLKYAILSELKNSLAHAYTTMTLLMNRQRKNKEALEYEKKAIAILETTGDNIMLSRRYISAAILSQSAELKDSATALVYYQKALDLASDINARMNLRDAYFHRARFYKNRKDYARALEDYQKHIVYRDSFINDQTQSKIAAIQAQYETGKKDNEIQKLYSEKRIRQLEIEKQQAIISGNLLEAKQKENEILLLSQQQQLRDTRITQQAEALDQQLLISKNSQKELELAEAEKILKNKELEQQKLLKNFMVGFLLMATILAYVLFNRYQLKKRLQQQNDLLAIRNHIAKDLHDEIGSTLTSIKILSQVSQNNLQKDNGRASLLLKKITEQSSQMQQGMSDIVWAIAPGNDKLENLVARMRDYMAHTLEPQNIKSVLEVEEQTLSKNIGMEQRRDFFLIFKEAINNAAKYSGATQVDIHLSLHNGKILMVINDNGVGFETGKPRSSNGLKNMQERTENLNGIFNISSVSGNGVKVQVEFPAM